VRRFTAEYLETTREGMWDGSRDALVDLRLGSRDCVLDEETPGTVVALDADVDLLTHVSPPCTLGDATRLPFRDSSFDLVVCQALLVNLPQPDHAIEEFARVSSDRVAVIEPDNSAVRIDSTVSSEPQLARRARQCYLDGLDTDASLGAAHDLFEAAGLRSVTVRRYEHERRIEPPYSEQAVEGARRKASGSGIDDDRETILAGDTTPEEFDELRQEWRAMGRTVATQMQDQEYRQREVVPFFVTVGQV